MGKNAKSKEVEQEALEREIPRIGAEATRQAYQDALKRGNSVVIVEDGEIVEVFPDGRRVKLKNALPQSPVEAGTCITLK